MVGVAAVATTAALALGGCGVTDIPSASGTVTVWVNAPQSPAAHPVPTSTPPSTTAAAIPTALVAGHAEGTVQSYTEAMRRVERAKSSTADARFLSPSGNIFCVLDSAGAACEVRAGRVTPPDGVCPPGGPTDVGRVELRPTRAVPVCNSDSIRTGTPPTLPYQTVTRVPGTEVTCLSEETGVTCVDPQNRHGFFIARGGFATF